MYGLRMGRNLPKVTTNCTFWCALVVLSSSFASERVLKLGLSRVPLNGSSADVYVVDTKMSRIGIYGFDSSGNKIATFENLRADLQSRGVKVAFATNGGMFRADLNPVGLLVQDGVERAPLNLNSGEGNFFLKPNGVFVISAQETAAVIRSEEYPALRRSVRAATQSGPLLVIDGQINSVFHAGSNNKFIRSGVGIINPHKVVFAISTEPVNFWDFALLFRDVFGCQNALYLDGAISKFYVSKGKALPDDGKFGVFIAVPEIP